MNYRIPPCIVAALGAAAIAYAGPAEDAKAAAKKLADAANYSWSSTTANAGGGGGGGRGGFGAGPQSGVAERGGAAVITRETQNGSMKTVVQGERVVLQTQNGWMTMEELGAQFGGGGRGGRGGFGAGAQNVPAAQLENLLASATDFKAADGAIVATLSADAVAPLLGGRGGAAPRNAAGTLKLWVADGMVTKYEYNVKGTVAGRDGDMQRDRTTTVEIKSVGSTTVELPAEAKAKLGA